METELLNYLDSSIYRAGYIMQKKNLTFSSGNIFCGKMNPIKVFHLVYLSVLTNNEIAQIYFVGYTITKHFGIWLLFLLMGQA